MKQYSGKNAWWLIIIIVFYNIFPFCFISIDNGSLFSNVWWILIWIFYYSFDLLLIPILIRNRIELYDTYFIFYYGFHKERIEIKDIKKLEKRRNLEASSANSLDRIYIVTKKKDLYVSLKNNDDFIKEIQKRNVYL